MENSEEKLIEAIVETLARHDDVVEQVEDIRRELAEALEEYEEGQETVAEDAR